MATVRIYKVAELLGTTSQEVSALLKRDHGIEVKSASSTIEEVVARQFVDRLSRQRNIQLPTGDIFAETPVVKGKKGAPAKKAPEPPKPAAPSLPPPRLVKTAKPAPAPTAPAPELEPIAEPEPSIAGPPPEPVAPEPPVIVAEAPAPALDRVEKAAKGDAPVPVAEPPAPAEAPRAAAAPAAGAPPPAKPSAPGRVVPPTLRLRIEEQRPTTPTPPLPTSPTPRVVPRPAPKTDRPAMSTAARPAAAGAAGQTGTTAVRPPTPPAARPGGPPSGQRPAYPSTRPQAPMGGPRPLPSQPVRAQQPGMPPRPPQYPQRPGMPSRPSYQQRPGGQGRPAATQRREQTSRPAPSPMPAAPPQITRNITLAEGMTVKDLADKLDVRVKDVLAKLLMKRLMLTINSTLDTETATMIAREFGADVQMRSFEEELLQVDTDEAKTEDIVTRAPVVTVMGHVDHGKTSLLDAIRTTRVAEREAGGITQHIGAYHVTVNNRNIVFLDTPGHEAFTLMRARGAKVTDIVVLVVAADDGVMPQTREAIDHARAANVPIIVAINKIDKPNAVPEKVKRELTELDLMPEEWGGKTVTVEVSAKKKQNLELLLEMILLVSELGELKANPKRSATGTVLEAKLDKGRGPVATVLVQDGTLSVGDTFIAGPIVGRVRALIDDRGRPTKSAGPSTPVEVLGLGGLPQPGDVFQVAEAAKARQIATFREEQAKTRALGAKGGRLTLESLQAQIAEGGMKELPIIIKADVQGSAEVLADTLTKLSDEKVKIRIIHSGVGAVNESDVLLASASNAIIIAFNVRPDRNAEDIATRERVEIRPHSVIYNVTDEMKKAMTGLLEPTFKEVRIGVASVRELFKVPKFGVIAGCMVTEGRITRAGDTQARLLRDNVVVYEGKIGSLRRFKDDVSEVKAGFECGIGFERFHDMKVGDVIEVFVNERVPVTA
ncbi:MAG: translation initiation factor IF-2 [Acidobacteria bacterium 13_1_40CM_65_14]|nr:MAG: translation initiation factor IF-2 [Acidobacteria bacterium 13_1_40CM_65_14]OLC83375.1 MAG: translation initiation factor IF-2 [Acidobacteria bacterium 13_1_40CM_4_65_8]